MAGQEVGDGRAEELVGRDAVQVHVEAGAAIKGYGHDHTLAQIVGRCKGALASGLRTPSLTLPIRIGKVLRTKFCFLSITFSQQAPPGGANQMPDQPASPSIDGSATSAKPSRTRKATTMRRRARLAVVVAAGALLLGAPPATSPAPTRRRPARTRRGRRRTTAPPGPAPGVTDDSIKVGVQYVDLASLGDVVTIDHGDYEAAYTALFDDINANGGINGRTVEPVFAGINPVGTEFADAACVQLTEDEEVFAVMGFFLGDGVLCPLETHQTAVIGGSMSPETLERAQAPWYTAEAGTDQTGAVLTTFDEGGEFDGTLGVYAGPEDQAQMDIVLAQLDELGIDVAESAVVDAPADDLAAVNAATGVIAQRFESSGVDQVLVIGTAGLTWASGAESLDYRPQLLLTDPNSILAYAGDAAGRDLSVLDDAVAGNLYGGPENIWNLDGMQACNEILTAAGDPIPEPDTITEEGADLCGRGVHGLPERGPVPGAGRGGR